MQKTGVRREGVRIKADNAKKMRCKTLIAVLEQPKYTLDKNFNIGTIIRNCDALGIGKLYIICNDTRTWDQLRTDKHLNATAMSAQKWVYIRTFPTTQACLDHLSKKRFKSIVTSPHVKSQNNYILTENCPLYTSGHLAIWFGNETTGVSDEIVQKADGCLQIPMNGFVESFNLATTTGIVLHHIANIRREYSSNKLKQKMSQSANSYKRKYDA